MAVPDEELEKLLGGADPLGWDETPEQDCQRLNTREAMDRSAAFWRFVWLSVFGLVVLYGLVRFVKWAWES